MENLPSLFSDENITRFFIKGFGIVLSILYFIYALVMNKQTKVMQKTVEIAYGQLLITLSLIQIFVAFSLLILAIVVL